MIIGITKHDIFATIQFNSISGRGYDLTLIDNNEKWNWGQCPNALVYRFPKYLSFLNMNDQRFGILAP